LAFLLHQRRMVSLASLDYRELGRCLLAAVASGAAVWAVFTWALGKAADTLGWNLAGGNRLAEAGILIAGTVLWLALAHGVLEKTGSALPRVAKKRLRLG
jgi:putative peptidoglycan lipid II flippase